MVSDFSTQNVGIYQRSVHSGKWIIIGNIISKLLSLLTFFVLARLLVPGDYGLMSIIFLVTGFIDTLTTPGFEKALMQKSVDAEEYLDSIWTFYFCKALIASLAIFFFAPPIAKFFNTPQAENLIRAGALFAFIPALSNSKQFYFFRELDFKKIFWRDLSGQIAYIIVAFAWVFFVQRNVWALFFGHFARYIAGVISTYVLYPYRQKFSFSFSKLRSLFGYGKWITTQNIIDYFLGMLDTVYIGRLLNITELGYYSKARDLSFVPVSPFFTIIDKVGFAAYSKVQKDNSKIREGFLRTFDILMAVSIPVFLVLATEGGLLVDVVLGKKWLSMVLPLKILACATIFSSLVAITKPIFDAVGRPDINVKSHLLQLLSLVVLIYFGVHMFGLPGVAGAMLLSWLIILVFVIFRARPILQLGWDSFKDSMQSLVLANGFVALILIPWRLVVQPRQEHPQSTVIAVVIAGIVYVLALYATGRNTKRGPWPTFKTITASLFAKS